MPLTLRLPCLVVVAAIAAAPSAGAAVITFSSPTMAATQECSEARAPKWVPLQRYEEAGVRVMSNEPYANRFMCEPTATGWQPLVLDPGQTSYGPITYWLNDSAFLDVSSLDGRAIRGIDLTIVERNSNVDWCSEILVAAQGWISLCDGFSGHVNFADYGFADGLTSFHLGWGSSGRPFFWDPFVRLNAIYVDGPDELSVVAPEVPEPASVALAGVAAALWAAARRQATRFRSS